MQDGISATLEAKRSKAIFNLRRKQNGDSKAIFNRHQRRDG